MSRIGKKPVDIPSGVSVSVTGETVQVKGSSATLSIEHRPEVSVRVDDDAKQVVVERRDDERESRAFHGLTRSLIANMIEGVTKGYTKELEVIGAGWNVQLKGRVVSLNVGYADAKLVEVPDGVTVEVQQNRVKVSGADKQAVGSTAARIRAVRPPEPYNGKGVKYIDERVIRKQGKAFGNK